MSVIKAPINAADPASIDSALRTEWLLTNGIGGYAMGTLLGANTRRYHGLLIAATKPPVGRVLTLHSVIEQLILRRGNENGANPGINPTAADVIDLSTQQFASAHEDEAILHPQGWRHLARVKLALPRQIVWTWRVGEITILRHLQMRRGENAITLQYQFSSLPDGAAFRVRPLLALRDFHALNRDPHADPQATHAPPYRVWSMGEARLRMRDVATWQDDPQWWHDFHYQRDRERGQESREHLYSPGYVMVEAAQRYQAPLPPLELRFGDGADFPALGEARAAAPPPANPDLVVAATQFIVRRHAPERWFASIVAGYPWFGDWGRDSLISLPGLILCTGRAHEAQSLLGGYVRNLRNGLIPNLFDDYGGAAHYNTVDASLWFVHAVHEAWRWRAPDVTINDPRIFDACHEIIAAYRRGTDFGIRMDEQDGLIIAGDPTTQLTWMDAKRDGVVFTPRCGKAVEINTLWHNALMCLSRMTADAKQRNDLLTLARRVAASFRAAFWWNERQCLHDCLLPATTPAGDGAGPATAFAPDGKVRPNQIFAVSLPFSPLNEAQQRGVVRVVGERLLTPFGLRTLDRDDPGYRGRYEGDLFQRDAAYHNGTAWPWLIGPYCEALLRVEKFSDDAKRRVREILQPLLDEMGNMSGGRCLGQIAEVYDGDPPHRPSGCPAQAWSMAEVLRVLTLVNAA